METGHSWDPEKKASGIKDMQPIMVASGILVLHKWWTISRIQDIQYSKRISPPGRGILKKKNIRDTIHFNEKYCNIDLRCTGLFIPRTSSVSAEQSQSGVEQLPEKQVKVDSTVLARHPPEIQIKQEDLKSLVDIPRLPHASGNRMLQNLKDFNSMPFMSKIEYLRTTAKFYRPIEKGNHCVTATLEDDGWHKRT